MPPSGAGKRVLWVTTSFPRYDGDSTAPFLLEMATGLQKQGWEINVLAPHGEGLPRTDLIADISVHRFRYCWPEKLESLFYTGGALGTLGKSPSKMLLLPLFALAQLISTHAALRRARREGRPYELVHSHWLLPTGMLAGLVAKWHRVPHVVTCHGSDLTKLTSSFFLKLKRWALKHVRQVHVNSPAMRDIAVSLHAQDHSVSLIPLGIAPPVGSETQRNSECVAFVGRLSPEKGADLFLQAFAQVRQYQAKVTATLVGDGPEKEQLKTLTNELGLTHCVEFKGAVELTEARSIIASAGLLVVPSRTEGLGLVALEALVQKTPVVASAVGGLPYALDQGRAGRLVEAGDCNALAQGMIAALTECDRTEELVSAGEQYALESFNLEQVSARLSQFYQGALQDVASR